MNWQIWFEKYGQKTAAEDLKANSARNISIEEMYQAFKARLIEELEIVPDNEADEHE